MSGPATFEPKTFLMIIAGGTASGKTSLSKKIQTKLGEDNCSLVAEDEYQHSFRDLPGFDPSTFNFDDPSARDHDLALKQLTSLTQGLQIECPVYSFKQRGRLARTRMILPNKVIIYEGLHALSDPRIRSMAQLRIFLEVEPDLRLARRIKRDRSERGRPITEVLRQYVTTVQPSHVLFVQPTSLHADLVLKSDIKAEVEHQLDIWVEKVMGIEVFRKFLAASGILFDRAQKFS